MKSDTCLKSLMLAVALTVSGGAALAQKPDKTVETGQMPNSRDAVKAEARAATRNTANTSVPSAAGEASTMTNNQPNMQPVPPSDKSRAEVRAEVMPKKPQFGEIGEKTGIPTNPVGKMATPK
ncbi:hypothetical protein [Variovorax sp. OV329]|uniref:hypothetical protein n=1 Tax=Variovorax sp. OV329 TaxID=1882825 RepID=UPI0008EBC211|nr:hypothetical protein [Variovorax sp. OV329]SFM29512.1 hypothetical protein SAMN05444747_104140 [Variovorax sp. OV329]